MSNRHLILGSRSPRRRELLRLLGLPFEVMASDVREIPMADETPAQLATRLSRAKAHAVELNGRGKALVIACDTVVALPDGPAGTRILGKPGDAAEAEAMLRRLRGRSHVVYSAATLYEAAGGAVTDLVKTELKMRQYSDDEIEAYVASGDPMDKAGAYAIQHEGFRPVAELEGCYANVMGLPLCHVARRLRNRGVETAPNVPAACQAHTGYACSVYRRVWTS